MNSYQDKLALGMIINLFGTCLRVWTCQIEIETFNKYQTIMTKHQLDYTGLFTNFDFLHELGLEHWTDLCLKLPQSFFPIEATNYIELRRKGKKVKKINSTDLLENNLLFQMYKTSHSSIIFSKNKEYQTLLFVQTEIGLCAKYEVKQEEFHIDLLSFELSNAEKLNSGLLLSNLLYDSSTLKSKKDDTLVNKIEVIALDGNR